MIDEYVYITMEVFTDPYGDGEMDYEVPLAAFSSEVEAEDAMFSAIKDHEEDGGAADGSDGYEFTIRKVPFGHLPND